MSKKTIVVGVIIVSVCIALFIFGYNIYGGILAATAAIGGAGIADRMSKRTEELRDTVRSVDGAINDAASTSGRITNRIATIEHGNTERENLERASIESIKRIDELNRRIDALRSNASDTAHDPDY